MGKQNCSNQATRFPDASTQTRGSSIFGPNPSALIAREGNIWQSQNVMVILPANALHKDMLFWEKREAVPPPLADRSP